MPRLVEVVGVAGVGKSTLTAMLASHDPDIEVAEFIRARTPRHLAEMVRAAPALAPISAAGLRLEPRLSWRDYKLLTYVTAWRRVLEPDNGRSRVMLLDQGPLYSLVRLKARRSGVTRTEVFNRWWDEMIRAWAPALSLVIWLDAPDEVLVDRINHRAQDHAAKHTNPGEARAFLAKYRMLLGEALEGVRVSAGTPIFRLDTSKRSPIEVATSIGPILRELLTVGSSAGQR